ncbi:MAG: hypothetical protein ACLFR1_03720 [Spirochaetia bacterium]
MDITNNRAVFFRVLILLFVNVCLFPQEAAEGSTTVMAYSENRIISRACYSSALGNLFIIQEMSENNYELTRYGLELDSLLYGPVTEYGVYRYHDSIFSTRPLSPLLVSETEIKLNRSFSSSTRNTFAIHTPSETVHVYGQIGNDTLSNLGTSLHLNLNAFRITGDFFFWEREDDTIPTQWLLEPDELYTGIHGIASLSAGCLFEGISYTTSLGYTGSTMILPRYFMKNILSFTLPGFTAIAFHSFAQENCFFRNGIESGNEVGVGSRLFEDMPFTITGEALSKWEVGSYFLYPDELMLKTSADAELFWVEAGASYVANRNFSSISGVPIWSNDFRTIARLSPACVYASYEMTFQFGDRESDALTHVLGVGLTPGMFGFRVNGKAEECENIWDFRLDVILSADLWCGDFEFRVRWNEEETTLPETHWPFTEAPSLRFSYRSGARPLISS